MIRPRRDARGTETCPRPDTIDPSIVSTSDWPGMPKGRLARAALAHADALVVRWLPGGRREGDEYVVRNPRRIDHKPGSFKINIRTGAWADFVTGEAGGDLVALSAWLDDATQLAAARALADELGLVNAAPARQRNSQHPPGDEPTPIVPVPEGAPAPSVVHPRLGKPVHVAEYRDAEGRLFGVIHRYEPAESRKQVLPLVLCADGTRLVWEWRGLPKPRPLYGLDLLAQRPGAPVVVVEGEPKCDAGRRLIGARAVVVAWPGGAKAATHVDWSPLAGRQVAIWPDADAPGIEAARWIADELGRIGAAKVGIVNPPAGVPEGWDLADAEREGWTGERVLARIREGVREPLALRAASGVAPAPDAPPAEAPAEARASPIEDDAAPFRALGH
jgi:putative DNA primase/helicase